MKKQPDLDSAILLNKLYDRFKKEVDLLKDHIDNRVDDVFNKMDDVYGEVIAMRQEQSGHQLQHDDMEEEFKSIKSLPTVAHELRAKKENLSPQGRN